MLFVTNHRTTVAPTLAAALFGVAFLWDVTFDQRVVLGLIMSLSFAMTHFILSSIQLTSAAMSTRYQLLFEASPTAVLEEDWSESVEYVRSEYTGKPERIRQFLMAYPAVVERAVGKARVLRANEAAMSLLEVRSPARFLGYRDPRIVTDENMEGIVSALVSLYGGETTWESDIPTRVRSGEIRWLQSRSVDTSTGVPGTSIVVALADITHLKSRNEAMADLVKAKDEFIANVSHELRTPLTAVIGLTSELARDGARGESEREQLLQLVAVQAAEMSNIVDDLLVAARAEMGTVPIDLQPVDLIGELKSTVGGLDVSVEMPEATTPRVVADPQRVRQILRNLLTNAQRYGGPLRRVAAGAEGGHAWLEVRDNGPGISADHANQIFEPYVTAHFGVQGSVGLGLAVARQLAELMGGSLTFERSQEESVFRLRLPLADRPEPALASHSNSL
jgi:signal transduction histidine kinase